MAQPQKQQQIDQALARMGREMHHSSREAFWAIARKQATAPRDSRQQRDLGALYDDPLIFAAFNQVLPSLNITGAVIILDGETGRQISAEMSPRRWLEGQGMRFADRPCAPLTPEQEATVAATLIRHYGRQLHQLAGYHAGPSRDNLRQRIRLEIVRLANARAAMAATMWRAA